MTINEAGLKASCSLSVTELAEFSCRTGDLESVGFGGATAEEGQVGHQVHQARQKKRYAYYEPEYSVQYKGEYLGTDIEIRGRIDGVYLNIEDPNDPIWLEEIKTSYLPAEELPEAKTSLHYGQLKIYAFLFLNKLIHSDEGEFNNKSLQILGYQTWYKPPKGETEKKEHSWNYNELKDYFFECLDKYLSWFALIEKHRQALRQACKALTFPFIDYRPNQYRLCQEVYRHTRDKTDMAFEAPTGIGKSVSVLFPSLKAIGEGLAHQIYFLTAKRSGQRTANETLALLDAQNINIKSVTLTSRQQQCLCENVNGDSTKEECPYIKNYYDKLGSAREYCLESSISSQKNWLNEVAQRFSICPYALARDMSKWLDVVVMDYNYMFDPIIRLERFESEYQKRIALVDESHNLIDRARSMYSVTLSEYQTLQLLDLQNLTKKERTFLTKQVNQISEQLLAIEQKQKREIKSNDWILVELPAKTIEKLISTLETIFSECLTALRDEVIENIDIDWLGNIYRCIHIIESRDEYGYFFLRKINRNLLTALELQMVNVNPSYKLAETYKKNRVNILFSGTLRPEPYIRSSLGLRKNCSFFQLPDVFSKEQMVVCIDAEIDMRYQYRDQYIDRIVETIYLSYKRKLGNYLVAFSSYAFMEKVYQAFISQYADIETVIQQRDFSSEDRQAFIDSFFNNKQQIGFVLMGGIFAEGVDFYGESLIGVIVVGQGLPQPDEIRNKIKDDFDKNGESGFLLAYQYPGLQRVLQTAGRLIRSETDKGSIVLLDKRFIRADIVSLLPSNWNITHYKTLQALEQNLSQFWK